MNVSISKKAQRRPVFHHLTPVRLRTVRDSDVSFSLRDERNEKNEQK